MKIPLSERQAIAHMANYHTNSALAFEARRLFRYFQSAGIEIEFHIPGTTHILIPCPTCLGSDLSCRTCQGTGKVPSTATPCPTCLGDGSVEGETCITCEGKGWVQKAVP